MSQRRFKTGKHWFVRFLEEIMDNGIESFNRYYSMYRAIVHRVDDPEGCQRIQLIIPDLTAELVYEYWAYPKDVFSGVGYGSQVLPRVGDLVWVEFELGNCEFPVWSHGHPGKQDVPKEDELKDTNSYWFKSPKGNLIIIDDTNDTIYAKHSSGQTIKIGDKAISLISDKMVSLGSENKSDEPALLGDKTEDLLKEMKALLSGIYQALAKDVATSASSSSPFLTYVNLTSDLPQLADELVKIEQKILLIKSKKVTLN